MKPEGDAVINDYEIEPMPLKITTTDYPSEINEDLISLAGAKIVDAAAEAIKLGNAKVMNVIMLGTIIKSMGLESIDWDRIIAENVKERFVAINIEAIKVGMQMV